MRRTTKNLLAGFSILFMIVAAVLVVNVVRNSSMDKPKPSPLVKTPQISEVTPEITETNSCSLSFSVTEPLVPGLNCKSKDLYRDVASNTPGSYSLTGNKLDEGYELEPGEKYLYVISYENTGTGGTGGSIKDTLPTGTTFVDASTGCTNASGTVTCTLGEVAASQSGQKVIRFKVNENATVSEFRNSATLTPTVGEASVCKLTNYMAPSPTPSPTPSPSPKLSPSPVPSPSPSPKLSPSPTPSPSPSPKISPSPVPSPSNPAGAELSCVVKRAYENDSRNSAGTYYLNNEIVDTNTISNGQTIVYNVVVENNGETAASDVVITDVLSSNLTFVDASSGCTYASSSRTVSCDIGSLSGGTQASKSIRVTVGVSSSTAIANTARVSSSNGQQDSCSININATGQVVLQPSPVPSELPQAGVFEITAGTLSIGAVLLLLGLLGLLLL